ncbi:UNVERIFIED_CONTAM: hypothetical protein FKN15_048228 [Acipenser sinensis]
MALCVRGLLASDGKTKPRRIPEICPFRPVQQASGYAARQDQLTDGRKTIHRESEEIEREWGIRGQTPLGSQVILILCQKRLGLMAAAISAILLRYKRGSMRSTYIPSVTDTVG